MTDGWAEGLCMLVLDLKPRIRLDILVFELWTYNYLAPDLRQCFDIVNVSLMCGQVILMLVLELGQIKNDIWISDWLSLMKACVLWCVFSSGISDHLVWAGQC